MADTTFQCSIVTPERAVLDTEATFASIPAHDGEIGILPRRAPLLCQLGIGALRVETPAGNEVFFVDRGFAQMIDNRLTVLTEQARRASEIELAEVEKALEDARGMEILGADDLWADERMVAIHRAKSQQKIKQQHG